MARNIVNKPGWKMNVVCSDPATPVSGGAVRYGSITGIALGDEKADGRTSVDFGPFTARLSVKDEATGGVAFGALLYYKNGATFLTNVLAGNTYFGVALGTVGNGLTATIEVLHSVP